MVTFDEIIKKYDKNKIPKEHLENIEKLLIKINILRSLCKIPFIITSGYRSREDHIRIYNNKGIFDENKIPFGSGHLRGECVDVSDPKGKIRDWLLNNLIELKNIGLWIEDFRYTKGWVHFGITPPKSGKRIFIPYSSPIPNPEIWNGIYPSELD